MSDSDKPTCGPLYAEALGAFVNLDTDSVRGPVAALDRQSGTLPAGSYPRRRSAAAGGKQYSGGYTGQEDLVSARTDSGGASRFFYAAKVSTAERNAGLPDSLTNRHATLKPIALTTYLAKLILPPPHISSRLLVPFCGTGSEIAGALLAGWSHVVGIDNDPESIDTAQLRIPGLIARGTK